MSIVKQILAARGIPAHAVESFLNPNYDSKHDPFLLPDMDKAVQRLVQAHEAQEKVLIYGDYDVDGVTGTALLIEAFEKFGFENVDYYLPNRFTDGYGMNKDAVERISKRGVSLIVTVDCGSLNHDEVAYASKLGIDVIITDHHNVADLKPTAIAVVNPKYHLKDSPSSYQNKIKKPPHEAVASGSTPALYPFVDLSGVGVAFKLVQALQTQLTGLPPGQEKWFLDLVALGTVCDSVSLLDENRASVYWGLKVLSKLRRPGLKALLEVSGSDKLNIDSKTLGFSLGPRINAAGRVEEAKKALDLVLSKNEREAIYHASYLNDLNTKRRLEQDEITQLARQQVEKYKNDPVLVIAGDNWNAGIVGIVASKIMEEFLKPTFILSLSPDKVVGSARSFGDFSVADAIHHAHDYILKGGGHSVAAGVTLKPSQVEGFRAKVNEYYTSLGLVKQKDFLLPKDVIEVGFKDLNLQLVQDLKKLEPYGVANPEPVFYTPRVRVDGSRSLGQKGQHLKYQLFNDGANLEALSFNAPTGHKVDVGDTIDVWYTIGVNEWNGRRTLNAYLKNLQLS